MSCAACGRTSGGYCHVLPRDAGNESLGTNRQVKHTAHQTTYDQKGRNDTGATKSVGDNVKPEMDRGGISAPHGHERAGYHS